MSSSRAVCSASRAEYSSIQIGVCLNLDQYFRRNQPADLHHAGSGTRTKRWKLLYPSQLNSRARPGLYDLYDLGNDPHEMTNLLGYNPNRDQYRAVAEKMKGRLVQWLEKVNPPILNRFSSDLLSDDGI